MKVSLNEIDKLSDEHSSSFKNLSTRLLFVRALYVYLIFKIVLSWKASVLIGQVIVFEPIESLPIKLFFSPGLLFEQQPTIFLVVGIALSVINLWRPNYVISGLLFWYTINYFRVHYALINGSDIVLVTLTFLSIGLSIYPNWKRWKGFQMLLFNGSSCVIKIQIAIIYLLSGIDKLYSPGWRNGDAFYHIISLNHLFNPFLVGVFPSIPWLNFVLSWCVIVFEIMFPVLIWKNRFRLWILAIGTAFHIGIIFLLSLVDFGLIMIVSYLIFLQDDDLLRFGSVQARR